MATRSEAAEPLRVCYVTHAVAVDGITTVIGAGTKLRADHEAVRTNPSFFHDDGLADNEKPSWRRFIGPGHRSADPPPQASGTRGVKVRVRPGRKVLQGRSEFSPGEELTIPAANARVLLEQGDVEVVG